VCVVAFGFLCVCVCVCVCNISILALPHYRTLENLRESVQKSMELPGVQSPPVQGRIICKGDCPVPLNARKL
jgi:hypothetical protein